MENERETRSFYRVATRFPPKDRSYQTQFARRGPPDPALPDHIKSNWDALSAFDTEEGARRAAQAAPHLGTLIVRYDIPENSGITWIQSGPDGHYDLSGDLEFLKACLSDFRADV